MKAQLAGALIACLSVLLSVCAAACPKVRIEQGTLRGKYIKPQNGRNISAFLGIPFAKPPVGDLRFRAPVPAEGWKGTFKATKSSEPCPQPDPSGLTKMIGNEDCLKLNVFVPKRSSKVTRKLPVMAWLYGGAFVTGSNSIEVYGPNYLLENDVILVSLSYRLGMLGFVTTGDSHSPGNYGAKDVILGLEWIQKNIAKFGGDPNRVTLFGESVGAMLAHFLSFSNRTNGLFHKMITQSSVAINFWTYLTPEVISEHTVYYARKYGCPTEDNAKLIACLRNTSVYDLAMDGYYYFVPTIEPISREAVLTETPLNLLKKNEVRDVLWISGITKDEGLLFTAPYFNGVTYTRNSREALFEFVEASFKNTFKRGNATEVSEIILDRYLGNKALSKTEEIRRMTDLMTDLFFLFPAVATLRKSVSIPVTSPVYMYVFDYRGNLNALSNVGVCHGDELAYIFSRPNSFYSSRNITVKDEDVKMARTMTKLWTSFAKHGVPTLADSHKKPSVWPTFKKDEENYLRITGHEAKDLKAEKFLKKDTVDFLTKLWDFIP